MSEQKTVSSILSSVGATHQDEKTILWNGNTHDLAVDESRGALTIKYSSHTLGLVAILLTTREAVMAFSEEESHAGMTVGERRARFPINMIAITDRDGRPLAKFGPEELSNIMIEAQPLQLALVSILPQFKLERFGHEIYSEGAPGMMYTVSTIMARRFAEQVAKPRVG